MHKIFKKPLPPKPQKVSSSIDPKDLGYDTEFSMEVGLDASSGLDKSSSKHQKNTGTPRQILSIYPGE